MNFKLRPQVAQLYRERPKSRKYLKLPHFRSNLRGVGTKLGLKLVVKLDPSWTTVKRPDETWPLIGST